MPKNEMANRTIGNAIQDAVRNASRLAAGEELWDYASSGHLKDARLAEIGMTGNFDIDLPDGRHYRVEIHKIR